VLPGTLGCIQATEAVKVLLDSGEPLAGRLLFYDAMAMSFETVEYRRNPDCPVCGDEPIGSVADVDYEGGCAVSFD
jgi:adenylyltransferase/sulfurtransferase